MAFTVDDEREVSRLNEALQELIGGLQEIGRGFVEGTMSRQDCITKLEKIKTAADDLRSRREALISKREAWRREAENLSCCRRSQQEGQIGNTCKFCGNRTD